MTFPAGFLWGSATAAHQVEGGNTNNDWYLWEEQGHTKDPSGLACDQYNRYGEDLKIAQDLGLNAFRMSIEWSRIEPKPGVFSDVELKHYRQVLKTARDRGLKTFVTLHHFTNPIWAAEQGGWANPEMPRWFSRYADFLVPNIGDLVDFWLTINEPNVNALTSYVVGVTPPGVQDSKKVGMVLANFLKAHAAAYHRIHDFYPDAKVSFAHHMRVFMPARWWFPLDHLVVGYIDKFWNHQLLNSIKTGVIRLSIPFMLDYEERYPELEGTLDYLGVNYYSRDFVKFNMDSPQKFTIVPNKDAPKNDMEWEIYPEGMYRTVMTAASYGWPVYITENGIADAKDDRRGKFICDHLKALGYAMEDGADVRGYLYWSLLDNFEWIDGYGPRFGLVKMDYKTQKRTIRESAWAYSKIAKTGSLEGCE